MPNVDSDNLASPVVKNTIGEPSGGSSGIEHSCTVNDLVKPKLFDRAFELGSRPTHVFRRRPMNNDRFRRVDHSRRFGSRSTTNSHAASSDRRLRLFS